MANIFIIKDMDVVDINKNNVVHNVEIAAQTEMESDVPTISIPIERCTKSHR